MKKYPKKHNTDWHIANILHWDYDIGHYEKQGCFNKFVSEKTPEHGLYAVMRYRNDLGHYEKYGTALTRADAQKMLEEVA